ncbi:MAG: pyridoxal phosphate-dependent aminotransferase [Clostridia bacterium]|nr:pyridoxal phosphate-dependent aminotransferase [Clostridia bacterium]
MISREMLLLGKEPSVIRQIFEYSRKRKDEIGADKVFDFSLGNPSIPAPKAVNETITRLVSSLPSTYLHGYTSAQGDMGVRTKIAHNIENRFNCECKAENIYMTCGAAASLTITLKAMVSGNEDEIIILAPYFPEYKVFIANAGAKAVEVKCKADTFSLDIAAIEKAINKNTKGIIINSPNNPSGVVFSKEELEELAGLLEAKQNEYGTEIYIISDEPYRELVYGDKTPTFIPKLYNNTVVCYSYSKSLSLPGERIGYIFVSPLLKDSEDFFAAVCGAGRSLGFVCAPSLLQRVVAECDGTASDIGEYDKNRRLLYNSLTAMGYEAASPDGAFYLFVKSLEADAAAFCERAKKYELLLVPSDSFGVEGYVRIAYCVSYEQTENSLPAFKALYQEYKGEK